MKNVMLILVLMFCVSCSVGESGPQPVPTLTNYDIRDLITYPDSLKGARVILVGEVFNIIGNNNLQVWAGDSGDSIYVTTDQPLMKIYEGDVIFISGYVRGSKCGKNAFGAQVCSPMIDKAIVGFEPPETDPHANVKLIVNGSAVMADISYYDQAGKYIETEKLLPFEYSLIALEDTKLSVYAQNSVDDGNTVKCQIYVNDQLAYEEEAEHDYLFAYCDVNVDFTVSE